MYVAPKAGIETLGSAIDKTIADVTPPWLASSEADAEAKEADSGDKGGLPKDPSKLEDYGYTETSHPEAAKNGHRTFENPATGDKVRHDEGKPGAPGHEGQDHFHRYNPNSTSRGDQYLDKGGNPVPRGSDASHLYPGD